MPEFSFTVTTRGRLCLVEGSGTHVLQRRNGADYVPFIVDQEITRVGGRNQCIPMEFTGDYRLSWEEFSCPSQALQAPKFSYIDDDGTTSISPGVTTPTGTSGVTLI